MTFANHPAAILVRQFMVAFPDDAARRLEEVGRDDAAELLAGLEPEPMAAVLSRLGPEARAGVFVRLPASQRASALGAVDPTVAVQLLARLPLADREALLDRLPTAHAAELRQFLIYPQDSAGHLMDPKVTTFRADARAGAVADHLRQAAPDHDPVVFTVDGDGRLVRAVSSLAVALSAPDRRLYELDSTVLRSVAAFDSRETVTALADRYDLASVPVVDIDGKPLGVIRQHTLTGVSEEALVADLQTMVGASPEERALSKVSFAVRKRLPWLQINLATAFIAAAVVGVFENTIAQFTALAVLLPVVAGQSGNTGAQAMAVTMRGLTLREIGLRQWGHVVGKEAAVGLLNGLAVAVVTMAGVYLWSGSGGLCAVIGLAMVLSMLIAGVAGASVPLTLYAAGQDPAQSSSILLTTVTDIAGFLSFLGLATLLSGLL